MQGAYCSLHSCASRKQPDVTLTPLSHTSYRTLLFARLHQASILGPGPRNNSVAQQLYDMQQVLDSDDLAEVRFRLLYRRFCNDDEDELKPEVLTKLIEVRALQSVAVRKPWFSTLIVSCPCSLLSSIPLLFHSVLG